jgi:hypothetical protein
MMKVSIGLSPVTELGGVGGDQSSCFHFRISSFEALLTLLGFDHTLDTLLQSQFSLPIDHLASSGQSHDDAEDKSS